MRRRQGSLGTGCGSELPSHFCDPHSPSNGRVVPSTASYGRPKLRVEVGPAKVALQMQLNAFTDYSLRVLVYAASRPDSRCLTADVAHAFGISRHHVVKVVNELQHLGYIETT